jgi:hypothetical protein
MHEGLIFPFKSSSPLCHLEAFVQEGPAFSNNAEYQESDGTTLQLTIFWLKRILSFII